MLTRHYAIAIAPLTMTMMPRTVRVFLMLHPVRSRTERDADGRPFVKWRAEWVSRGTGVVMYRSGARHDRAYAEILAREYLARHPELIDATDLPR